MRFLCLIAVALGIATSQASNLGGTGNGNKEENVHFGPIVDAGFAVREEQLKSPLTDERWFNGFYGPNVFFGSHGQFGNHGHRENHRHHERHHLHRPQYVHLEICECEDSIILPEAKTPSPEAASTVTTGATTSWPWEWDTTASGGWDWGTTASPGGWDWGTTASPAHWDWTTSTPWTTTSPWPSFAGKRSQDDNDRQLIGFPFRRPFGVHGSLNAQLSFGGAFGKQRPQNGESRPQGPHGDHGQHRPPNNDPNKGSSGETESSSAPTVASPTDEPVTMPETTIPAAESLSRRHVVDIDAHGHHIRHGDHFQRYPHDVHQEHHEEFPEEHPENDDSDLDDEHHGHSDDVDQGAPSSEEEHFLPRPRPHKTKGFRNPHTGQCICFHNKQPQPTDTTAEPPSTTTGATTAEPTTTTTAPPG